MNLAFLPLYDRIIVRPADEHGKTKAGLWIPEVAKANKLIGRGEIIAVGGGRITMEGRVAPLMCRVGDLAIYAKQQAQPIPWGPDEEEVHVLREPEILGVYRIEEATSDLATLLAERRADAGVSFAAQRIARCEDDIDEPRQNRCDAPAMHRSSPYGGECDCGSRPVSKEPERS